MFDLNKGSLYKMKDSDQYYEYCGLDNFMGQTTLVFKSGNRKMYLLPEVAEYRVIINQRAH